MDALRSAVLEHGADLGIALDGDADRCLAVDATGRTVVTATRSSRSSPAALKEPGQLTNDTVVATVMSNLGFLRAMEAAGITVSRPRWATGTSWRRCTPTGSPSAASSRATSCCCEYATTGDGVLTGLHLMSRMAETGRSLADLASVMVRLPQVLVNVPEWTRPGRTPTRCWPPPSQAASTELGRTGRVLLRPSGTESLVRVMVEAETLDRADEVAQHLAEVVRERLAL